MNKKSIFGAIMFLVIALAVGIPAVLDYNGLNHAKDITEYEVEDIQKRTVVRGTTELTLGAFLSESSDGTETYRWYLIPIEGKDHEEFYFFIRVNKKNIRNYETIEKQTEDIWNGDLDALQYAVNFQGRFVKADAKKQKALDSVLDESQMPQDMRDCLVPYYLELKTTKSAIIQMIAAGVGLALSALIFLLSRRENKKENEAIANIYVNQGTIRNAWNDDNFKLLDSERDAIRISGNAMEYTEQAEEQTVKTQEETDSNESDGEA